MTELQEARLLGRAIRARWAIPDTIKAEVITELARIATEGLEESSRIAASRAIIAAEGQNQRDEMAEADDFKQRVLAIAQRCGVRVDLLGIGEAAGGGPDSSGTVDVVVHQHRSR